MQFEMSYWMGLTIYKTDGKTKTFEGNLQVRVLERPNGFTIDLPGNIGMHSGQTLVLGPPFAENVDAR